MAQQPTPPEPRLWGYEEVEELSLLLVQAARNTGAKVLFVTNELGMGIHPPTALGRRFQDLHGFMNQKVGDAVDSLVLMVSGSPLVVR